MAAAILAILTGLFAVLLYQNASIHVSVTVAAALAAACLALVAPFDASEPPARKRVVVACGAYLVMIGLALVCAVLFSPEIGPLAAMVVLGGAGTGLLIWAFRTRNRVRRSIWSDYYDR